MKKCGSSLLMLMGERFSNCILIILVRSPPQWQLRNARGTQVLNGHCATQERCAACTPPSDLVAGEVFTDVASLRAVPPGHDELRGLLPRMHSHTPLCGELSKGRGGDLSLATVSRLLAVRTQNMHNEVRGVLQRNAT